MQTKNLGCAVHHNSVAHAECGYIGRVGLWQKQILRKKVVSCLSLYVALVMLLKCWLR